MKWIVPRIWPGETVAILGGGPSLTQAQVDEAKTKGWHRIAVNNAFLLDPEADVLCWGDIRWWFDNRSRIPEHVGPLKITWRHVPEFPGIEVKELRHTVAKPVLAESPGFIYGANSGHGALNLAKHFGVSRIVLLGFDMTNAAGHNWHTFHKRHASEQLYSKTYIPEMILACAILERAGIDVINCTPGSALTSVRTANLTDLT